MLTSSNLLTFRDKGDYTQPTEVIPMSGCSTVKSSDEEINKTNSFVSAGEKVITFRNWRSKGPHFICMLSLTQKKKAGLVHLAKR